MSIKIKISKKPIDYDKAIRYLEKKVKSLHSQKTEELLWILSHPSIYTAGISTKSNEILDKKINVIKTNRGGKITWHGPGQIIIYFLLDVKRLNCGPNKLVATIQDFVKELLLKLSIECNFKDGAPGVYVDKKKIASIGLRISKGKSYHGISLNFDMDLLPFKQINPCGYEGLEVTQIKDLNKDISKLKLHEMIVDILRKIF